MEKFQIGEVIKACIIIGFGIMALLFIYFMFSDIIEVNYKKGQIDALTGRIKYELVTKPDSTKVWEKIIKTEELK